MITGYNTDVEHDGVVYHVQTEDKGLETPLVLSLVYSGGAILASKRSTYHDLIAAGFDEAVLTERLQRQHRLICAAINAGRIADLKKLGAPQRKTPPAATPTIEAEPAEQTTAPDDNLEQTAIDPAPPPAALSKQTTASPYTVYDSRRRSPLGEIPEVEEGLRIALVGDRDFRGGDQVELQVTVTRVSGQGEAPVSAAISVKILGTSFRPVILSLKTNRQGSVTISTRVPPFKSGRAAIVIKATAAELSAETRRVVHPS
jgi:hypothetical protein